MPWDPIGRASDSGVTGRVEDLLDQGEKQTLLANIEGKSDLDGRSYAWLVEAEQERWMVKGTSSNP